MKKYQILTSLFITLASLCFTPNNNAQTDTGGLKSILISLLTFPQEYYCLDRHGQLISHHVLTGIPHEEVLSVRADNATLAAMYCKQKIRDMRMKGQLPSNIYLNKNIGETIDENILEDNYGGSGDTWDYDDDDDDYDNDEHS